MKKKCVAMLLAGGQGVRLCGLTSFNAKPAVGFGGKYRIIDFTLSNCAFSGIDTVGVLTQYQPMILNEYIGTGESWDLDVHGGGVHVLPPYMAKNGAEWYSGTANAVYQNLNFLKRYPSEHVLILSGDHIYKMDYSAMLDTHTEKSADCTIATIEVPLSQASQFGIMNFNNDTGRITEFLEKPKEPIYNKASMGVYIFKTEVLIEQLEKDELDKNSNNDFGKDIIPKMLAEGLKLYAYKFSGYWKDVGTIQSLWQANMDLLGENSILHGCTMQTDDIKIYSKNSPLPPAFLAAGSSIDNCILTAGAKIFGTVKNSIISDGVIIESGAKVHNSVLLKGAKVKTGAKLNYTIVNENAKVAEGEEVLGSEEMIVLVEKE